MYERYKCTRLVLGKELFRIGLFVVEKIGVKIRKTRLKYGKQRSRSTQMGGKGLATLVFYSGKHVVVLQKYSSMICAQKEGAREDQVGCRSARP